MIDAYLGQIVAELQAARGEIRSLGEQVAALRAASPPRLLTVPQAAQCLGISTASAWRRVADGSLPSRKIGRSVRISVEDLRPVAREQISEAARSARA